MARGRFISNTISLDEKVNRLSDDTCRLLFTWMISHLDREGRLHGDAQTVKSIVFPRRSDISVKKIEKYLQELEKFCLITRYFVDGNQYLCMKNFEKHQPGLRKDREACSQIPPFTPDLLPTNDGESPIEVKVKVKDKDKEEVKEESSSSSNNLENNYSNDLEGVLKSYADNIGKCPVEEVPEIMGMELKEGLNVAPAEWILDAIQIACDQNKPNWAYVAGILKNWARFGRQSGEQPNGIKFMAGKYQRLAQR